MAVLIGSATGGTGADWNASLFGAGSKRTALSSGTLRSVWMHKKATDAATLANAELGIYADDGGGSLPGTLLGKCRLGSLPKGVNKFGVTLATPVTLVSGTSYWLAWWQQGATQYNWQGDVGGVGYTEANVGTGGLPSSVLRQQSERRHGVHADHVGRGHGCSVDRRRERTGRRQRR